MGFVAICVCIEWPYASGKLHTCLANYKCQKIPLGKCLLGLVCFFVSTRPWGVTAVVVVRCIAAASVMDYVQYFSRNEKI